MSEVSVCVWVCEGVCVCVCMADVYVGTSVHAAHESEQTTRLSFLFIEQ